MRRYVLAATLCVAGLSTVTQAAVWNLNTMDTRLTLDVTNDQLYVVQLDNPVRGWNWTPTPVQCPLLAQAKVGGVTTNLTWQYVDGTLDTNVGQKVTLRFQCVEVALGLTSEWWARPGRGPVRHAVTITNMSAGAVTIGYQASAYIQAIGDGPLSAWYVHTDGWTPDATGLYVENITGSYTKDLPTHPEHAFIPFVALTVTNAHGMYVGTEWSAAHTYIQGGSTTNALLEAAGYADGRSFTYAVAAGSTFAVPPTLIGAYNGDRDDGGNSLRKYLWDYSMPGVIRDDTSYPKVQWNAFVTVAKTPGAWDTVQSKWNPFIDSIVPLGFEEAMHDVGWNVSGASPVYDATDWPLGMKASFDYAKANGLRAGLYLAGPQTYANIKYLYDNYGIQVWRSDGTAGAPYNSGYDSIKGFYSMLASLTNDVPGFQWENCNNGGRIKDFGAMQRAVKVFLTDTYGLADIQRAFFDASHLYPGAQLMGSSGTRVAGVPGTVYSWRTGAQGAPEWFTDSPDGGNSGGVWSTAEKEAVAAAVGVYKKRIRPLQRDGDIYHLTGRPDGSSWYAFEYYKPLLKKGVAYLFKPQAPLAPRTFKLRGLDPATRYVVSFADGSNSNRVLTGASLMTNGIEVGLSGGPVSEWMFLSEGISLTAPREGPIVVPRTGSILLEAMVSQNDGSISRVEFLDGTNLITSVSAPTAEATYSTIWSNVPGGYYTLVAKAYTNGVLSSVSDAVSAQVTNPRPSVAIRSPVYGAATGVVLVEAVASGAVTRVEFYQGNTKLGEVAGAPYAISWTNAIPGHYALTAVAVDTDGIATTSTPVNVSVVNLAQWVHRAPITFSGYTNGETLTNFPALVRIGTNIDGFAWTQFSDLNGSDLLFVDNRGLLLAHEFDSGTNPVWTNADGIGSVWVQVPELTGSTTITAYWGRVVAERPAYTTNGAVWTAGYVGVWHLGDRADSTANRVHGTGGTSTSVAGRVGGGQQLNGLTDSIDLPHSSAMNNQSLTISGWINPSVAGQALAALFDYDHATVPTQGWVIQSEDANGAGHYYLAYCNGSGFEPAGSIGAGQGVSLVNGQWQHIAYTKTDATVRGYRNGAVTWTPGTAGNATVSYVFGRHARIGNAVSSQFVRPAKGIFDELRVANVPRSPAWIWAEYNNAASNATFAVPGTVSTYVISNPPPTVAVAAQALPATVTGTTATVTVLGDDDTGAAALSYTWSAGGSPPAPVSFTPNNNLAATHATATFTTAGNYDLQVVIRDPFDATVTSTVAVVVQQTATTAQVSPASVVVHPNARQQFTASARDQFGDPMASQPAFGWGVTGGGSVDASGLFTAGPVAGGPYTVTATAGALSGQATVSVGSAQWMRVGFAGYTNRTEVLTNFPVLLVFSNKVQGLTSTNGYDLRFVTNLTDTASLDYEIESWNTNGPSYVWVRLPALPPDGSGWIWATWGDPARTNQLPCTTNGAVWEAGYQGVWHFATNGANLSMTDSTANRNHAVAGAGTPAPGSGRIGHGAALNGTSDITVPASYLNGAQTFTVTLWYKSDGTARVGLFTRIVGTDYNNDILLGLYGASGIPYGQVNNGSDGGTGFNSGYTANTWAHEGMVFNGTAAANHRMQLFHNGMAGALSPAFTEPTRAPNLGAQVGRFGSYGNDTSWFLSGGVDEARISSVARSADWVWAEWMNMASNGVFCRYGTVTNTPPSLTPYEQWKRAHFTTDELTDPLVSGDDADPDRDGMGNAQEYLAGTAPKDGNSRLAFTGSAMQADGFVITWQSATGKWYVVLAATNLAAGFGESVTSHVQATPPINVHTDRPPDQAGVRFYRVDVE